MAHDRSRITRRAFNGGVLGLSALAASSLRPAAADTPRKGGTFRVGISSGATTDVLDPGLALNENLQVAGFAMRNCLIEVGPDAELVPELAESWEPSADAATWVVKLRKGVEFHNGKALSTDDVLSSINWHRRKESTSQAKELLDQIDSITSDATTLTFKLKGGNAGFPAVLAHYNMQIFPANSTAFEQGTGGYILENFEPGVSIKLKRNPNYWKADRAHFDEVEVISVVDKNARQAGLVSGSLDYVDRLEPRVVKLLSGRPNVKVIVAKGGLHYALPMRTDTPPFDNNDVRLALKYAIDRESVLKTILSGFGDVGNDQPISSAYRYFNKDLPQRVYDPEKAKFLLKKAGHENLSVELSTAEVGFAGSKDVGSLYREHAAKAGIDIKVIVESEDTYWDNVWEKKPWCAVQWYGSVNEDIRLTTVYSEKSPWNDTFWKNARFNQLLVQARSELDDQKRRTMYGELQSILCNDGGVVIPVFVPFLEGASAKLASGKISTQSPLDGTRIAERWWWA